MYTTFFNLKENPFNLTPDPKYLFLSPQHKEALNHLIYGINEKKGFIVITGGIGTGKTTICRALLSALDKSIETALIFNSFISDMELLATINHEFGITSMKGRPTKKRYIDSLNKFLLKNFASGRNAVLLIDEAQNLSLRVLEQIRMLSNLETEKEKLLQIVLIGQPELQKLLMLPSIKQLNERITVRYNIKPLSESHIRNYIEHRLDVAGGANGNLKFLHDTYKTIYACSQGIPRRINSVCDRALLIAYSKGSSRIDKKTIKNAVSDIGAIYTMSNEWKKKKLLFSVILLLFGLLAVVAVIYGYKIFQLISTFD